MVVVLVSTLRDFLEMLLGFVEALEVSLDSFFGSKFGSLALGFMKPFLGVLEGMLRSVDLSFSMADLSFASLLRHGGLN